MPFGQIVRQKRQLMDLTLDEVSRRVGFSKPYLSSIETGKVKNPPSDELLIKLEKVLEFERGELLRIAHMESVPCDIRQAYETTEAENQNWRQFIKSLIQKRLDTVNIEKLLEERKLNIEKGDFSLSSGRLVPVINKVSAGYPTDFNELDYPVGIADDYIRCPGLHDPNAFAVRVVGDSMEKIFKQGDIIVFSPLQQVKGGDYCFVRFASPHETTFKKVFFEPDDKIRLQPSNEKYSPLIVDIKRISGLYRAVMKFEKL